MLRKWISAILAGALFVVSLSGCSQIPKAASSSPVTKSSQTTGTINTTNTSSTNGSKQQGSSIVKGKVQSTLKAIPIGSGKYKLIFTMQNQMEKPVSVTYNSTQHYDYTIKDANGNLISQYSKGRLFGMIVHTFQLKQGEKQTYEPIIGPFRSGTYSIHFWSTAVGPDLTKMKHDITIHVK